MTPEPRNLNFMPPLPTPLVTPLPFLHSPWLVHSFAQEMGQGMNNLSNFGKIQTRHCGGLEGSALLGRNRLRVRLPVVSDMYVPCS